MSKEIEVEYWKDIKGYKGLYQVSNLGRIKSLERITKYQNSKRRVKEKIKGTFTGKKGYERVELSKNGQNRKYNVHTLVAKAFLNKKSEKSEVNHINGVKTDNRVENLEWCTHTENIQHMIKCGRKVTYKGKDHKGSKEVHQYDKNMNLIAIYESSGEASRKTGFLSGHIREACRGTLKTYKGFIWKYA